MANHDGGISMEWKRATETKIEENKEYLVKTNGDEWLEYPYKMMFGTQVIHCLQPTYIRGRPIWIAEITDPDK